MAETSEGKKKVYVHEHTKEDGTKVKTHYRSTPNTSSGKKNKWLVAQMKTNFNRAATRFWGLTRATGGCTTSVALLTLYDYNARWGDFIVAPHGSG